MKQYMDSIFKTYFGDVQIKDEFLKQDFLSTLNGENGYTFSSMLPGYNEQKEIVSVYWEFGIPNSSEILCYDMKKQGNELLISKFFKNPQKEYDGRSY